MLENKIMIKLFLFFAISINYLNALLYPAASSLTVTSSVSVPVTEFFPERRILIDWCFAMTYSLPSTLSSFYNIPIWPGHSKPKYKRSALIDDYDSVSEISKKYLSEGTPKQRHASDFTAGELYQGLEDFLVRYGFNETCLLRTVCELAQHPFDDLHQNVLTDLINFILTPSLHEGFGTAEELYRITYEDAESRGFLGENCARLYPGCRNSLLNMITQIIT